MSLTTYIAVSVAVVSSIVAIVVLVTASRRRTNETEAAGNAPLLSQIEQVRGEIRALSELFLVPRTRGAVGETLLAELLRAWLPERSYELQYSFSTGSRVDAVIRLGERLVPVDSKFPLEAYQRAREGRASADGATGAAGGRLPGELRRTIQKHIEAISSRYLLPDEGTMPFALMYIPAEPVYIDLFASRTNELLELALANNVVPTSPSTLFLYLQTVAYGLRGLSIPREAAQILENIKRLDGALAAFQKEFGVATTHLRNLTRAFDEAKRTLSEVERARDRLIDEERT
ncbi:MAG: DNA recombination protein RmuC [Spirochaetales bacterium]